MDMKIHMLYNKIKVEIDINNGNCMKTYEGNKKGLRGEGYY
jgi:hypothetical protein